MGNVFNTLSYEDPMKDQSQFFQTQAFPVPRQQQFIFHQDQSELE
jgi:hypothetical protein